MRYWHPFTEEAIAELAAHAPEQVVLLPLYPQYSKTTTGSSINEWNRCFRPNRWRPRMHVISEFYDNAAYLDSLVAAINQRLRDLDNLRDLDIIFSAHSVPVAVIEQGDPYQRQIERTVELVWRRGGWPARRHICYQSKIGASKWLRPSVYETIDKLASAAAAHVLVVPISFVSDHVETLHEIDIEHREQARRLGIPDFRMMPGLNDSPGFISALAGMVQARISAPQPVSAAQV
jgi:ferrochelatase